jgi:septum formation protein
MKKTPLILASGSKIRAQILKQAGLDFKIIPAEVDEEALKDHALSRGHNPKAIALMLAREKAKQVAAHTTGLVIGADQILQLGNELISKSENMTKARAFLQKLSDKTHYLHCGVALYEGPNELWSQVYSAELTVRRLSDSEIDAYLEKAGEGILSSVGCYQLESLGVQLFSDIKGDYFTILGLPLLPLLGQLRRSLGDLI